MSGMSTNQNAATSAIQSIRSRSDTDTLPEQKRARHHGNVRETASSCQHRPCYGASIETIDLTNDNTDDVISISSDDIEEGLITKKKAIDNNAMSKGESSGEESCNMENCETKEEVKSKPSKNIDENPGALQEDEYEDDGFVVNDMEAGDDDDWKSNDDMDYNYSVGEEEEVGSNSEDDVSSYYPSSSDDDNGSYSESVSDNNSNYEQGNISRTDTARSHKYTLRSRKKGRDQADQSGNPLKFNEGYNESDFDEDGKVVKYSDEYSYSDYDSLDNPFGNDNDDDDASIRTGCYDEAEEEDEEDVVNNNDNNNNNKEGDHDRSKDSDSNNDQVDNLQGPN